MDIPARPIKLSIRLISRGGAWHWRANQAAVCWFYLLIKDLVVVAKFICLTEVLFCCQFFVWEASEVQQCQRCNFP